MPILVTDMNLALIGNSALRAAIQRNLVSFPSQVPAFSKGGDKQRQIVQLYFVRGWPTKAICDRYTLSKSAVRTLLSKWKNRAVAGGYIQDIHAEYLAALAAVGDVDRPEQFEQAAPDADFTISRSAAKMALPGRPAVVVSAEMHF
jgi:hypothetical protein